MSRFNRGHRLAAFGTKAWASVALAACLVLVDPFQVGGQLAETDYKSIVITTMKDGVEIRLPLTDVTGPVRVKRRADDGFGLVLAPTREILDESCYLEWQIGYDTIDPKDPSVVPGVKFERNGRMKYGSEFTRILAGLLKSGSLTSETLRAMLVELKSLEEVDLEKAERVNLRPAVSFDSDARLPQGFERFVQTVPHLVKTSPFAAIEIQFKPKQRAVGYQPMVYVCLPLSRWRTADGPLRGPGAARRKETIIYEIDDENTALVSDIVRAFGAASRQHNKDLANIIEALLSAPPLK